MLPDATSGSNQAGSMTAGFPLQAEMTSEMSNGDAPPGTSHAVGTPSSGQTVGYMGSIESDVHSSGNQSGIMQQAILPSGRSNGGTQLGCDN